MPTYGVLLFSDGCRMSPISKACRDGMLAVQSKGRLNPAFASEINALFESDPMLQIQVDRYLTTLTSVASDLKRLFGNGTPSELRVKWALDTKTQQGSFPTDAHIKAMRAKVAKLTSAQRHANLMGMVNWYDGLCQFPISEGIRHDCAFNRPAWAQRIDRLYAPSLSTEESEVLDLMNLTWLRSVQSQGNGGAYQALTFQRRVTIILGTGSVAGHIFKS